MAKRIAESYSRYWMGSNPDEDYRLTTDLSGKEIAERAIILAARRRAIAGFVTIVTGENIPVVFQTKDSSYTDGKQVVLSGSTKEKSYDALVGLALHEASHILLSDFGFLRYFMGRGPDTPYHDKTPYLREVMDSGLYPQTVRDKADALGYQNRDIAGHAKTLFNIIEDRRIDYYLYKRSPGYRPYYKAMYDHYFFNNQIAEALRQGLLSKDTSVESYIETLIQIMSPWFDTRLLPDLDLIYGKINLAAINRLSDEDENRRYAGFNQNIIVNGSRDYAPHISSENYEKLPKMWHLIMEVLEIIYDNALAPPSGDAGAGSDQNSSQTDDSGEAGESGDSSAGGQSGTDEGDEDTDSDSGTPTAGGDDDSDDAEGDDAGAGGSDEGAEDSGDEGESDGALDDTGLVDMPDVGSGMTAGEGEDAEGESGDGSEAFDGDDSGGDRQEKHADDAPKKNTKLNEKRLENALKRQRDFLNGEMEKKNLHRQLAEAVEAVKDAEIESRTVEYESTHGGTLRTDVRVIRRVTRSVAGSSVFPFTVKKYRSSTLGEDPNAVAGFSAGKRMGAVLANQLAVRNQNQVTTYNRQDSGKIDRRRLASLGARDVNVFKRIRVNEFDPVFVHFSIDASSSMRGSKWEKSIALATALAYAADKISNLDVEISVRASTWQGDGNGAQIAIVYDSRSDNFTKASWLFPALTVTGGTPEGLTFEAYMKELENVRSDDKYFLNISDGEPAFSGYGGEHAYKHTRQMVNRLRESGMKIMSYFVANEVDEHSRWYNTQSIEKSKKAFGKMYGASAEYIDVTKVVGIARTLNKLFLS